MKPIKNNVIIALAVIAVSGAMFFVAGRLYAEQDASLGMVSQENNNQRETAEMSRKLNEIADAQKMILEELRSIKEDMAILKIRVTQNQ